MTVSVGLQMLGNAGVTMRRAMVAQSRLNPANASGISAGHWSDGPQPFKLGGIRYDAANPDFRGWFGGIQGKQGFLFGVPYRPGSWQDALVETYAGPHDYLNSWFSYDASGNIRAGMSGLERGVSQALNWTDVILATPFGTASAVPPASHVSVGSAGLVADYER